MTLSTRRLVLSLFLATALVLGSGVARVEAASTAWALYDQRHDEIQYSGQNYYITSCSFGSTSSSYKSMFVCGANPGTFPNPAPSGWTVSLLSGGIAADGTDTRIFLAVSPSYPVQTGTFSAGLNKDTYAANEPVAVSLSGGLGSGSTGDLLNLFCTWGCTTPTVGVAASFGGAQVAGCQGSGSTSCTQTFNAPATAGVYQVSVAGCVGSATTCSSSNMSFTVVAPLPPAVQIFFSFVSGIRTFLTGASSQGV